MIDKRIVFHASNVPSLAHTPRNSSFYQCLTQPALADMPLFPRDRIVECLRSLAPSSRVTLHHTAMRQ